MTDLHKLADVDCKNDLATAKLKDDGDLDDLLTDLWDMDGRLEKLKADANGFVSIDQDTLFDVTEILKEAHSELCDRCLGERDMRTSNW